MNLNLDSLAAVLQHHKPGWTAQKRAAPAHAYGRHRGPKPHSSIDAAVMVLLAPTPNGWSIPFTVRPLGVAHPGQVSFPGGRVDGSESTWDTAQRELSEELGVLHAQPLGFLSPLYVYASNHWVNVAVGYLPSPPRWIPCAKEVAAILEAPLPQLLSLQPSLQHVSRGHFTFQAPGYTFEKHFIWGATAMILEEFLACIRLALKFAPLS